MFWRGTQPCCSPIKNTWQKIFHMWEVLWDFYWKVNNHMRKHNSAVAKPKALRKCDICPYETTNPGNLSKHTKNVHKEKTKRSKSLKAMTVEKSFLARILWKDMLRFTRKTIHQKAAKIVIPILPQVMILNCTWKQCIKRWNRWNLKLDLSTCFENLPQGPKKDQSPLV